MRSEAATPRGLRRTASCGAAILAAAALSIFAPPGTAAGTAPLLRWHLPKETGLLYKVSGPDPKALCDGAPSTWTLYGSELLADGTGLVRPVGRPKDLCFHYLFALPKEPLETGRSVAVDEVHEGPPFAMGPVRAQGEVRAAKRQGGVVTLVTTLKLSRDASAGEHAHFQDGTLSVTASFNEKKNLVVSGSFELKWTEGTPPKAKPSALNGALEMLKTVDLGSRKLRDDAEACIHRAIEKDLRPVITSHAYRQKGAENSLGWLGLLLFAAVKGGMDPSAPPLAQAFDEIDALPWKGAYSVAFALLALESRSVHKATPENGETRRRYEKGEVDPKDLDRMKRLAKWLIDNRTGNTGYWWYGPDRKPKERDGDLSITQCVALALHAAARSGVEIDPEVWRELGRMCTANQVDTGTSAKLDVRTEGEGANDPKGDPKKEGGDGLSTGSRPGSAGGTVVESGERKVRGFCYYPPKFWRYPTESMTGAGVSSLLIVRQWLKQVPGWGPGPLAKSVEAAIPDGLAWLQTRLDMHHNWPDQDFGPYYNLYSVEKALEIARIERIGGHDWWAEGAHELMLREKTGGGFGGDATDTAFAVLFLTRASAEPELHVEKAGREASGGNVKPGDEDAVVIEGTGLVSAREVIRATEVKDPDKRRDRIALAEKAISRVPEERRPIVAPALGQLLASSYPECRKLAEKELRSLAGAKIDDAAAAEGFLARYDEARTAGHSGDLAKIQGLRSMLKNDALPGVRLAAALALSRLRAVEAVPDLIAELERPGAEKEYKSAISSVLIGTVGEDGGPSPSDWRALWARVGPGRVEHEEIRRDIQRLAPHETRAEARKRLVARGRSAIRPLIEALPSDAEKAKNDFAAVEVASVLKEITGKDFALDRTAWEKWWEVEKEKP